MKYICICLIGVMLLLLLLSSYSNKEQTIKYDPAIMHPAAL